MTGNFLSPSPEVIASWPAPNYDDPVRRTWMPEFAITWQVLATLLVGTRLWLRYRKLAGPLGLDDALLVPAYLGGTMLTVTAVLGCEKYGADRHMWDVRVHQFPKARLTAWLSVFAFLISTTSTKISVLLFYRRLVKGSYNRRWFYAILFGIAFTALSGLSMLFALLFPCSPVKAYWLSADYFGWAARNTFHCADTRSLNLISGILSALTDLYAVVLPVAMLRHIGAPQRQKIALFVLFGLGIIIVGTACARTYHLTRVGDSYDLTWEGFKVYVWALLECQLALIVACVPATRVLFRRYFIGSVSKVRDTIRSSSLTTGGSNSVPMVGMESGMTNESKISATVDTEEREVEGDQDSRAPPSARKEGRAVDPLGDWDCAEWSGGAVSKDWWGDVRITTPDEYEAYNLAVIERHRREGRESV